MNRSEVQPESASQKRAISITQLPGRLVSRRWWWTTLLVIAGVIVLVRLGFWQLERLETRRQANAAYKAKIETLPLDLNEPLPANEPLELLDRRAIAEGTYDYDHQLILGQQNWQGAPGVHLITPLILRDGTRAILVDRGWIPNQEYTQGNLDRFDESGAAVVTGTLQLSQELSGGGTSLIEEPQEEWYRIDIGAIQKQLPYELLPVYMIPAAREGTQDLPLRSEPEVDLSDGPHLSYAIQWFSFALMLAIGYGWYVSRNEQRLLE